VAVVREWYGTKEGDVLPTLAELNAALEPLRGGSVVKPSGSTLAGHAAGLPFEDLIHARLLEVYPGRALRHFEALNRVLLDNPQSSSYEERIALLGLPATRYLLARGKEAMTSWSPAAQFGVKQNDTAESIIFPDEACDFRSNRLLLIDVKTQDADKKSQPPNIMSSDKLARACVMALESGSVPFELFYIGVKWRREDETLVCVDVNAISMMQIKPESLYVNWVAAQQLQFHPFEVDQSYAKSHHDWCLGYIDTFCNQLENHVKKQQNRLVFFRDALRAHS
jgi:hypothetical protein